MHVRAHALVHLHCINWLCTPSCISSPSPWWDPGSLCKSQPRHQCPAWTYRQDEEYRQECVTSAFMPQTYCFEKISLRRSVYTMVNDNKYAVWYHNSTLLNSHEWAKVWTAHVLKTFGWPEIYALVEHYTAHTPVSPISPFWAFRAHFILEHQHKAPSYFTVGLPQFDAFFGPTCHTLSVFPCLEVSG